VIYTRNLDICENVLTSLFRAVESDREIA